MASSLAKNGRRSLVARSRYVPSSIENEIRELENRAFALLPLSAERQTKFGTQTENKIARVLRDGYLKILETFLPSEAVAFLDQRLRKALVSSKKLHLVGKLEAPFTCATAPINKLLVVYLLSKNPNMYVRGKIDTASKKNSYAKTVRKNLLKTVSWSCDMEGTRYDEWRYLALIDFVELRFGVNLGLGAAFANRIAELKKRRSFRA